jgi:putative DNA primase/helicase
MPIERIKDRAISLRELALHYTSNGFHVIPIHTVRDGRCSCREGAKCGKPGKHPVTSHGVTDATTDRKKI